MKSSLEKLGRKLSMHKSGDGKEKRDHQPSVHLDELAQASRDMQDMRDCYDGLLSAAAAMANSIYEFSESLNQMANCLLGKTAADADAESGKVISTLGNMQLELQKIADTYRSYVILTVTNPSESLLSELRKVEEMKLQCDEKREAYEYMKAQYKEKGKLRNAKVESTVAQKLQEAQDEYDEVTRLCVFRVKSLKEGQCRSLLTQAARHHAAQLNFFRKGLTALEAVESRIRNVAEKHRIDYQLSGLHDGEGEPMSSYESTDDGEVSFDYRQKKEGLDNAATSPNPMELDQVDQVSNLEDSEINLNKYKGEQIFGKQGRVGSYSAPLYPEKIDKSERLREMQPQRKFYSYVLPPPVVDTRNPISKPPTTSVSHSNPFQNHERHIGDDASTSKARSTIKDSNAIQLPAPSVSAGRLSLSQSQHGSGSDGSKVAKRQSYSGPLPPSKQFSFKMASTSGPIPQQGGVSHRSASPPPLSSPKISELHELPRPPAASLGFSKYVGLIGSKEISPPNKRAMLTSPLPPPPLVVPRSFSIPSSSTSTNPQVTGKPGEVGSPPLMPISLSNMKSLSNVSGAASRAGPIKG